MELIKKLAVAVAVVVLVILDVGAAEGARGTTTTAAATTTAEALSDVTSKLEFTRQDLADLKEVVQELRSLVKSQSSGAAASTSGPLYAAGGGGGATYVRWGRTSCPSGSEMMYSGYTAGSHYKHKGAATNELCVPMEPEYANFTAGLQNDGAFLYETEYYSPNRIPNFFNQLQNVPCAVCRSPTSSSAVMVPAKTSCFPGWKVEYFGYLMADHHDHAGGNDYICVDHQPENVVGGETARTMNLLYFVETQCGQSLPCPPFKAGHELTCVVCSK